MVVGARGREPRRPGGGPGRHSASVALPTLSRALHASESDLQWFSSGYFLVLAAAMLPAGLLGDRYGHRRVLLIALGRHGAHHGLPASLERLPGRQWTLAPTRRLWLSELSDRQPVGLRERKKARTRAAIRAHALGLFRKQGYDATTVQQIIADADVSESTFFRYFPTKGEVVLSDDFDPLIVEAFLGQPADLSPIQAMRAAFRSVFNRLSKQEMSEQSERMRLILSVPELRAAMLDQFASAMGLLTAVLAERTGRRPDDMAVRTLAGSVVGVAMAVLFTLVDDPAEDVAALLDQAMAHLESGLQL
jgi:AcrR family transcriptional regulator